MEEVVFLTATVQRLDSEIARLNSARAALLRRLNAIRPISRALPPETLALIFAAAAQPPSSSSSTTKSPTSRASPLLIGSVCSHWRQIAWSTPILWTFTDPVPIHRNAQPSDAHLLRLYFANARALPIHVQIKLDRLSSSPSASSEEILRAVFIENSHNIASLVCTSKSSLRQRWAMLAPKLTHAQFPQLRKVEISLRGAPLSRYDEAMFVNAPVLTRISFMGYHLPHETLRLWEQMTVLELSALPASQCLETLVKCTRLQEFRCTSPRPPHRSVDVVMHNPSTQVVELEHLTKFEWVGSLADWDVFLYTYVRLPNLRHLVLGLSHPLSRPLTDTPLLPLQPPVPQPPPPNAVAVVVPPAAAPPAPAAAAPAPVPVVPAAAANPPDPVPPPLPPTTDPSLWKSFLLHTKSLHTLELSVFHSADEWLDVFDIVGSTLHTLKFTAFRDAEETVRVLRGLLFTYDVLPAGEVRGREEGEERRNCLPALKTLHVALDLHPERARVVLDVLCSRRIRPLAAVPPPIQVVDSDTVTLASTISSVSTVSNSSSSAGSSVSGGEVDPNDWLADPRVDDEIWADRVKDGDDPSRSLECGTPTTSTSTSSPTCTYTTTSTSTISLPNNDNPTTKSNARSSSSMRTRLEHATIKCWPFGFEFGERERSVCELLRRSGMVLEVLGGAGE
ncbi:hypothetical protein D9756_009299 [Leucocoprinus leucothites]|uniref:F-box domain-containing protein n=1 Tax=Leucocoprinus leucothites TaxID=201217 RepID=A0A8H5CY63_9AGAR|nr:hypothetical protein D9756_009299 [Leucoagaricus leucothites]